MAAVPGVSAVGITAQLPFTGDASNSVIIPEGYVPPPGESLLSPYQVLASPGYFDAMGIDLVEGRTFRDADGPDAMRVMVIDEWLARRYWPDRSPLGDRMHYGVVPGSDSIPPESVFTIVGVVKTIKHTDLTAPASEHVGAYYFCTLQRPPGFQAVVVRAGMDPSALAPALRRLVSDLDPELPLYGVETMRARIDDSLRARRIPLVLLVVFAGVALFLAVVGIYGALAYSVTQRTREIGIRMAMGCAPTDVFRSVVGQGLRVTGVGLVVGVASALLLTRLIRSLLFEVQPGDPRVILAVAVVLAVVGLVACLIPARRATAVDPVSALGGV
jgi:predicted permease